MMTTKYEMNLNEPVILTDNLVEKVWGGDWITQMKGLQVDGRKIGESWEFSTHEDHPGAFRSRNGNIVPLKTLFPNQSATLLIKYIDASDNLSLQVHPADDYARLHENSCGKSESWYVLDTATTSGAGFIYLGFSADKRRSYNSAEAFLTAFKTACLSGSEADVLSFVNKIRVSPGDIIHVTPGTIHAVGKGVRLFEIQQSSGLTYRLWDWGRNGRELHLEKAFKVLDVSSPVRVISNADNISDPLGQYEAEIFALSASKEKKLAASSNYYVLTVVEGELIIQPKSLHVRRGQSVLVPANVEVGISSVGLSRVLKSQTKESRLSSV